MWPWWCRSPFIISEKGREWKLWISWRFRLRKWVYTNSNALVDDRQCSLRKRQAPPGIFLWPHWLNYVFTQWCSIVVLNNGYQYLEIFLVSTTRCWSFHAPLLSPWRISLFHREVLANELACSVAVQPLKGLGCPLIRVSLFIYSSWII